jgi:hypothetical protein
MTVLLHPAYFPNCVTMAVLARRQVIWEGWDNYQKQTNRNRCYICTDRGAQMLSIPIKHVGGKTGRQTYRDVRIDNNYLWQRQHWRGLQTAYRSSPFFEFYEADLRPLFEKPFTYLMDLNLQTIEVFCNLLGLDFPTETTQSYLPETEQYTDARDLVIAKGTKIKDLPPYPQVFQERHGFVANLSCLDLLFNEGNRSLQYLQNLHTPLSK